MCCIIWRSPPKTADKQSRHVSNLKRAEICWLFCPYSLFLLSPCFSCFVEIKTELGDPDGSNVPLHNVSILGLRCPSWCVRSNVPVSSVCLPSIRTSSLALGHRVCSSGLFSLNTLPLGFDMWGGEARSKLLDLYSLLVNFYKALEGANGRWRISECHTSPALLPIW